MDLPAVCGDDDQKGGIIQSGLRVSYESDLDKFDAVDDVNEHNLISLETCIVHRP